MKKTKLRRLTFNKLITMSNGSKVRFQYKFTHKKTRRYDIHFSTITSKRKPVINLYKLRFVLYNSYYGMVVTRKSWSNYRHRGQNGRQHKMCYIKRFNPDNLLPY